MKRAFAHIQTLNLCILLAALSAGCAHFSTKQYDYSIENGKPVRQVTTKATAWTFFSSSSQLAQFKAQQTDKTQSAAVGTLNQQASAATNVTDLVGTVVGAAVKAATGK